MVLQLSQSPERLCLWSLATKRIIPPLDIYICIYKFIYIYEYILFDWYISTWNIYPSKENHVCIWTWLVFLFVFICYFHEERKRWTAKLNKHNNIFKSHRYTLLSFRSQYEFINSFAPKHNFSWKKKPVWNCAYSFQKNDRLGDRFRNYKSNLNDLAMVSDGTMVWWDGMGWLLKKKHAHYHLWALKINPTTSFSINYCLWCGGFFFLSFLS